MNTQTANLSYEEMFEAAAQGIHAYGTARDTPWIDLPPGTRANYRGQAIAALQASDLLHTLEQREEEIERLRERCGPSVNLRERVRESLARHKRTMDGDLDPNDPEALSLAEILTDYYAAAEALTHVARTCCEDGCQYGQIKQREERIGALEDGYRYILGDDVAGYDAHMLADEVAAKLLHGEPDGEHTEPPIQEFDMPIFALRVAHPHCVEEA